MKTITSVAEMQAAARRARGEGVRIGFVPTMGALHQGHLSLVRRARELSDICVVSIFVNPTQFGPGEDFDRYARDLEGDTRKCVAEGVDILFAPSGEEMYSGDHSVTVTESALSQVLCGASRPGHFQGVLTVVAKLLNAVMPDVAVFGQKDAQQALLVARMIRDLKFPVQLVVGETVRECDGLAMSSRNAHLSATERESAASLHAALCHVADLYDGGERDAQVLQRAGVGIIREAGVELGIDYFEVVDVETLQAVSHIKGPVLVAVAVQIGATRLVDNIVLPRGRQIVT
jgi:pantoate--beta-alanine ligase